ncbi:formylglycine-generating enzyme family protein [Gallaecimonas sp. GXIMD4217]|uniref:formylglycine-generating enzyme family protein n=1 Tax=Gallaecimonas sp. GXIMD4217 TaxID=3131927 RepID=UPI00311B0DF4
MLTALVLAASAAITNQGGDMVSLPAGLYRPLYLSKDSPLVQVAPFQLDRTPVTNRDFLAFVSANPKWAPARIPGLFAENGYLSHWSGGRPRTVELDSPVTRVSWFAAQAYCRAQGKRLPRVAEWEFAARASQSRADGSSEPGYNQRILSWYARPNAKVLPAVAQSAPNFWGLHDMHGLIWEWTEDFNSALVSGESRADSSLNTNLFCGSGAAGAADPSDYAAFMRFGYRASLKARFTQENLGFRCARDGDITDENP